MPIVAGVENEPELRANYKPHKTSVRDAKHDEGGRKAGRREKEGGSCTVQVTFHNGNGELGPEPAGYRRSGGHPGWVDGFLEDFSLSQAFYVVAFTSQYTLYRFQESRCFYFQVKATDRHGAVHTVFKHLKVQQYYVLLP